MANKSRFTPSLPIEIFSHHVFLKLAVKSLSRFKCVCKEWNNVLHHPHFVRMHLHLTTQQKSSRKLLLYTSHSDRFFLNTSHSESYIDRFFSVDHNQSILSNGGGVEFAALQFPFEVRPHDSTILGSINGLVCISVTLVPCQNIIIVLWNPSTRDYKVLPPANRYPPIQSYDALGFAYDSLADDYKIVRILNSYQYHYFDIYSLKSNSWKFKQDVPINLPRHYYCSPGCSLDESIYWLGSGCDSVNLNNKVIACFNLKDDKFREIPQPGDRDFGKGLIELKLLGRCFCVCQCSDLYKYVMWTINKEDEWTKIMTIDASSLFYVYGDVCNASLLPICLLKDRKILLKTINWLHETQDLVVYDPKTKSFKFFCINWICKSGSYFENKLLIENPPSFSQETIYVESLVSPNSYVQG